jgi:hypothetical protein
MQTYIQFLNKQNQTQFNEQMEQLNELTAMGVMSAVKLQRLTKAVKATDDVGKKIDILTKGMSFALGTIALGLHKKKRR